MDIQHIKAENCQVPNCFSKQWYELEVACNQHCIFPQPFGQVVLGKAGLVVIPLLVALTTLGAANGNIFAGSRYETASMVCLQSNQMLVCIPSLIPGLSMQLLEVGSFLTCLVESTEHTRHPCLQPFFTWVRQNGSTVFISKLLVLQMKGMRLVYTCKFRSPE